MCGSYEICNDEVAGSIRRDTWTQDECDYLAGNANGVSGLTRVGSIETIEDDGMCYTFSMRGLGTNEIDVSDLSYDEIAMLETIESCPSGCLKQF